jgi:transposase
MKLNQERKMSKRIPAKYTPELRAEAVKMIQEQKLSYSEASKKLGIPEGPLAGWVIRHNVSIGVAAKLGEQSAETLRQENLRLRKELAEAKMERDILKKAAGDSTGHCNTAEIVCEGDKKFNVFLGRSFNSSAMILSCSCV